MLALPFLVALLILGGCDSTDPDDNGDTREVAGLYRFTEFIFVPEAPAVESINVLDTLSAGQTDLRLSSDGTFIFSYQFVNGTPFFLNGGFAATSNTVQIAGIANQNDTYARILLTPSFTLRRDENNPDLLTADIRKTINPSQFSNRYRGINSINGTLRLRLEK
jgi:hypothetical protein